MILELVEKVSAGGKGRHAKAGKNQTERAAGR